MNNPAIDQMGTPLRYWCRNCDQSFGPREVGAKLPACTKGEHHNLVPIYVEANPEDDEVRSDSDYGEGD